MDYGYLDTETCSNLDLKKSGTIRYAEKCAALAVSWIPPHQNDCHLWECHKEPMPRALRECLADPDIVWVAHNSQFDRGVLVHALGQAQLADPRRWVCTAALCRYAGIPASLGKAGKALGLPAHLLKFDDSGGIELFTKRYSTKFHRPDEAPEKWRRFMDYAVQDTITCREIHRAVSKILSPASRKHWRDHERDVFILDQLINAQGFPVSPDTLDSALMIVAGVRPVLERQMGELTGGEITKLGSPKLVNYLRSEFFMRVTDMRQETRLELLEGDIPDPRAEKILLLRHRGNRSSLAKYGRMDLMMSDDNRIRAGFLYHGAHTGRLTGLGCQPTNLPRPIDGLNPVVVAQDISDCDGDAHRLEKIYAPVPIFDVLVTGIRGAIQAGKGKVLVVADYNQVESRLVAWTSGCQRKLKAFRDHDSGESHLDPYEITARDILGDSSRRQAGKTMDLGLGFGMGAAKFSRVAKLEMEEAERQCYGWRDVYPEIPALWDAMALLFQRALGNRGYSKRKHAYLLADTRLPGIGVSVTRDSTTKIAALILPNGKPLFYPGLRNATWAECLANAAKFNRARHTAQAMIRQGLNPKDPLHRARRNENQLVYLNVHSNRAQLVHGGFLAENWIQGTSREITFEHALRVQRERCMVPVHTCYDELTYEIDIDDAAEFETYLAAVMSTTPEWLPGLPLTVDTYTSERYAK